MSIHVCVTTFAEYFVQFGVEFSGLLRIPRLLILQRLIKSLYLALIIANYMIVIIQPWWHMIIIISIVSVQLPHTTKVAHENGQGGYQTQSSTQSFSDMQAHWWLFKVERAGKAVQIIPINGSKFMNISIFVWKRVQICWYPLSTEVYTSLPAVSSIYTLSCLLSKTCIFGICQYFGSHVPSRK